MEPVILHSDLNCFYAAVEVNEHPELSGKAVAVCGSTEDRHGIVLAKTYPAKARGVKTGMAVWEAQQSCPGLICVPPHYDLYLRYSRQVRQIYADYSDAVEPFGMDECWLSLPWADSPGDGDIGLKAANELRRRIREETGLTVSIGVSFSKIFAKLGSDMKKPDAVTRIGHENYRETVWPLPVSDLLYVGPATTRKLLLLNLPTIGSLAQADPELLRRRLGINGIMLWRFANGTDRSPVAPSGYHVPIKSVGHGVTCTCDLHTADSVWRVLYELAQDVGHRLRLEALAAKGVQLTVRDSELGFRQYQAPLGFPTRSPLLLARRAFSLFQDRYPWILPVRALAVRAIEPVPENAPVQLDLFCEAEMQEKRRQAEDAIDDIRRRFGTASVRAASLLGDKHMAQDRCETVPMPAVMYR